jgi:glycolate oxidase iron-sulfur subunit
MTLAQHYDEIAKCNRCGFCQSACPIFRASGNEAGVARGRLALLRAVVEERLDLTPEIEAPLFNCLLCGACTANCFPAIETTELLVTARAKYLEIHGRKTIHRLLFDHLLPYPRRLHLAARAVALGKISRLSDVARALGLLRFLGRDLHRAEAMLPRIPLNPLRRRIKPGPQPGSGKKLHIAYFVGCGVDVIGQEAGLATLRSLKRHAKIVHLLDNGCCGLPAWSYGDLDAARNLAARNLKVLAPQKFDAIVSDCASCAAFLKSYPKLFDKNDPNMPLAEAVAAKAVDIVAFLADKKPGPKVPEKPLLVTYHDPCHAVRGQGLTTEPRAILEKLPGIEYRELPEADWCCGGAGSYALANYDLSQQVLERKMQNVKKTGADLLVTACPACVMQLSYGVTHHGLDTRVCHISQVVDASF